MTEQLRPQRRGGKIAMTKAELDEFLAAERTCRVATNGTNGPHATPLWFVWDRSCIWLYSLTRSQRWADLMKDPRLALVVDAGHEYLELRGVEITGTVLPVGEIPRRGEPNAELAAVEAAFAAKYTGGSMPTDGRHAWLKLMPSTVASWDFRKLAGG